MDFWKGLGNFLWKVVGIVLGLLAIFQWVVKLKVTAWVIPSWILLLLIVLVLSITGFTAYWVMSHSTSELPGMPYGVKTKKPKLKPSKEIMFILLLLAEREDQRIVRRELSARYRDAFKGTTAKDFNLVMMELNARSYVSSCGVQPGDTCIITDDGLSYFSKYRKKFEPIGGPPTGSEKTV